MKKFLVCTFFALSLLLPTALMAEVHTHEGTGLQVWLPDAWTIEGDKDSFVADSGDGVSVTGSVLTISSPEELEAAMEGVDEALSESVKDLEWEEPEEEKLNGLDTLTALGAGTIEGVPVKVAGMIIAIDGDKFALVVAIGTDDAIEKHGDDLDKIAGSFKLKK